MTDQIGMLIAFEKKLWMYFGILIDSLIYDTEEAIENGLFRFIFGLFNRFKKMVVTFGDTCILCADVEWWGEGPK